MAKYITPEEKYRTKMAKLYEEAKNKVWNYIVWKILKLMNILISHI